MDSRPRQPLAHSRLLGAALAVLIVVVLTATYAPAIFAVYGCTDDFPSFFPVDDTIRNVFLADARPTAALLMQTGRAWVERMEDLGAIRGVAILAIGLFCVLLFHAARRVFPDLFYRAAVCVAVGCLPAFTVFAAWATMWFAALGVPIALAGAMLAWRGCRYAGAGRYAAAAGCWGISLVVTLLLFTTYQPLVTWFWVVGLIAVLDARFVRFASQRRRCAWFLAVGLAQLVPCFLFMKLYFPLTGVVPKERVGLVTDPLDKLLFLMRTTVPQVLTLWQVIDVNRKPLMLAIAVASALVLILGIGFYVRRANSGSHGQRSVTWGRLGLWLAAVAACLVLCHLHGIVVGANVKNYRTVAALSVGVALLFFWSLGQIVPRYARLRRSRAARVAASLVVVALSVVMARTNLEHYFTRPGALGYAWLVEQLEERLTPATRRVHLIRQGVDDGIVTERPFHSFGRPLTEVDWVMPGLVIAALRDAAPQRDPSELELTHSLDPAEAPTGDDVLVIDMRELKRFRE